MADAKSVTNVGQTANLKIGGKSYTSAELSSIRTGGELSKGEGRSAYAPQAPQTSPLSHGPGVKMSLANGVKAPSVGGVAKSTASHAPQVQSPTPLPKMNVPPVSSASANEEQEESTGNSIVSAVAGKQPQAGASLGAAYFAAHAAQQLANKTANTGNTDAKKWTDRAGQARAQQSVANDVQKALGGAKISDIPSNMGLEAKASFFEAMGRYKSGKVSLSASAKNALSEAGNLVVGKVQGALASSDDLGDQVGAGMVGVGTTAYATFKVAQAASPLVIKGVRNLPENIGKVKDGVVLVGKGAWDVATTAGKATATLARTGKIISSGFIPMNSRLARNVLTGQAYATGLAATATSQRIVSGVKQIQKTVSQIKTGTVQAVKAVKSSYTLVRNAGNTVMTSVISHQLLLQQKLSGVSYKTVVAGMKNTVSQGIVRVGKGAWDVATTAGKATATLVKTGKIIRSGFIPINSRLAKNILTGQAYATGLAATSTSQRIVSGVKQMRKAASQIKTGAAQAARVVKAAAAKTTTKGLTGMAQGLARGAGKGGAWTIKRGVPGVGKAAVGIAGMLASSDDMMVQGVGNSVMLANYGVKTAVTGIKTTRHAVKTARGVAKKAKGAYNALAALKKTVREKGLRAAWEKARKGAGKAVAQAGKSVVSAVMNLIKAAGQKVVVPALIIVCGVVVIISVLGAPAASVGGIFSGMFGVSSDDGGTGTHTEMEVRTFITNSTFGIPALRAAYIDDLYQYMQDQLDANGGGYDYVRFKCNTEENLIDPTVDGISSVFYTEEELANIIQPIYNAVILKDYELDLAEERAKEVLEELFYKLFLPNFIENIPSESASLEWCGQSAVDGSGTVTVHGCGDIHALNNCPNFIAGYHGSYVCGSCCRYYYTCDGHSYLSCEKTVHTHSVDCYSMVEGEDGEEVKTLTCTMEEHAHSANYCFTNWWHSGEMSSPCSNSTRRFRCSGYRYCEGHNVLTVTLNMDGLYELLYAYFEKPINDLSNKANRTEDEEKELANLKDSYEICLEYISEVTKLYGGGMTMEDLDGTQWVRGSRVGDQNIVDIALSQVGQVGGQPYWSWYGFESHVEWCACFVSWCMNRAGHSEVRYSSCQWGGLPYFKDSGKWADSGFTDLAAGDVIFFDWEQDGKTDHTGIVIGRDDAYIYTVEGNMGDSVQLRQYAINSSVISGFGLMS